MKVLRLLAKDSWKLCAAGLCLWLAANPGFADNPPSFAQVGLASYYADKYHGRTTASGEIFDTRELTAAHRTLPFGTRVKVTSLTDNRSVIVRIVDRGPFVEGRVIDLSRAAAEELQMIRAGLRQVRVEVIPPG